MADKLTGADLKEDLAKAEAELQYHVERAAMLKEWITATKRICGKRYSSENEGALTFIPRRRTKTNELVKNVADVLTAFGRPMHVNLIAVELDRKGHPINAKNPAAALAVSLSRRPEAFKKVGPNLFDLVRKKEE